MPPMSRRRSRPSSPPLRRVRSPPPRPAEWPDTPELQRSDAAFIAQDPKLAGRQSLAVQVAERVGRFAGQPPPDRWTSMSPFDWYAWSLAARLGEAPDPQ